MKATIYFSISIFAVALTSCAPKKKSKSFEPTPQQISWCEAEKNRYEDRTRRLHVEYTKYVKIERHFQRVLRYDCKNNLLSDRVETVKSPREMITLRPSYPKLKDMSHVELLNIDTCDRSQAYLEKGSRIFFQFLMPVTGQTNGEIKLNGDIAPALLTYKLKKGANRIYYTYRNDLNQEFSGIYDILVDYSEISLPGFRQVRAEKNCSR